MLLLVSLAMVDAFSYRFSSPLASVPMLIGLTTIGMGHGALDSELIFRKRPLRESIRLFLSYMTVMVFAGLCLWWIPEFTLVCFLGLTLIHFGKEESESVRAQSCRAPDSIVRLFRISHGWLVIVLPLLVHPTESGNFFRRVERMIGQIPSRQIWESDIASAVLMTTSVVVLGLTATRLWAYCEWWTQWIIESAVIAFAAVQLHPEFFIGLYLLVWHAPTHLLGRYDDDRNNRDAASSSPPIGDRVAGIGRTIVGSLPFLAPAWLAVALLVWIDPATGSTPSNLVPRPSAPAATGTLPFDLAIIDRETTAWLTRLSAATVAVYVVVTPPHHLLQCGWFQPELRRNISNLAKALLGETVSATKPAATAAADTERTP